jgi:hypothetical protein
MAGTSGSTYLLEGDSSELRQHANQQVEVRGRLESSSMSGSGSSTGSTAGGSATGSTAGSATGSTAGSGTSSSATGSSSSTNAQRLRVESVRMIASTCSSR